MAVAVPPDAELVARPWVRSYPPGVPATYRFPAVTVTRFLDDAVRDFGDGDALVTARETIDYGSFNGRVTAVAAVLAEAGIEAGDRVLVALPNQPAAPVVLFALWRLAAVAVPVDPGRPAEQLIAIVGDAEVAAMIAPAAVLSSVTTVPAVPPLLVQVDGTEWSRRRRSVGDRLGRLRPAVGGHSGHAPPVRLAEALRRRTQDPPPASAAPPSHPQPEAPAVIAYPAGGDPSGIVFSHANLVAGAFQVRLWVPDVQAGRERVLVTDRFDDLASLSVGLLAAVLAAAAVVLVDDPDSDGLARTIERQRPTLLVTRPERLAGLVRDGDAAKRDLTSLRVVLACGEPLDPALVVALERRTDGGRVRACYGVAEAGPLTHAQPVYGRVTPGSVGVPVTGTLAAVVDPAEPGVVRPPGQPGALLVGGPQAASGYWRRDERSSARFVGGWVVTDELVSVDVDGVFRVVGRRGEVIERDGAMVWLRQVEGLLERHPSVRDAALVVSDDGDLLAAVVTRRRARLDADEMAAYCRAHLDSPAVPGRVIVVPSLPRTDTGALDRDELSHDLATRLP